MWIGIQRTKDGFYVINHDGTFKKVAGDSRKPEEMTLSEGKKALVWTANEKGSQRHFLCTEVDGIITDNVSQALEIARKLESRSDIDRMVDKIKTIL